MNDTVNQQSYRHLYGPVPSRRLGRSLGIDLVPFKTCTYDCVYCQLGRTTDKTVEFKEYVPVGEVLAELGRKLAEGDAPDYISLAGSGEPTLNSGVGRLIEGIKALTRIPVAVITNGSLLWDRRVADSLLKADLVVPSLDAGDSAMFGRINRPHHGIDYDRVVEGLISFRGVYKGRIWLEVMLLDGWNDGPEQMKKIGELAGRIKPDRVQLNTAVRPPAESTARPVPRSRMQELARMFTRPTDIISDCGASPDLTGDQAGRAEDVLSMIARRPCTVEDVALGLGSHRLAALKDLEALVKAGRAEKVETAGRWFYLPAKIKM